MWVFDWNGTDLPEEFRRLPPGRYVVEPLAEATVLTSEEEDGLLDAIASLERGEGIPHEEVMARARAYIGQIAVEKR